ncbi:MAG: glycosyltransferase family 2 protein [Chthoniobacterales bacterium]|nr:glycosyltransferase family 2 protein [Chthoniobacterales bacterium]
MKKISIVSGCFNEAGNVEELVARVAKVMESLPGFEYEQIIIDNASTDGTQEILRKLASANTRLKVILNARNFGHIRSPYYGLMQSTGEATVAVASDLQEPPELIPEMIKKWEEGAKAVVAIKGSSDESTLFFAVRRLYYLLVEGLAEFKTVKNFTGFGLYDRVILDYCRKVADPYPYFRGQISEIGLPIVEISYHQAARKRGITKNNFFTLYDLAMLGITNHSKVPLRLAAMLGFAMALLSLLVALVYFVYKLVFWYSLPVGTAPLVIGLFFFASVQLFFIGILGEYIGAIHTQVLKRPLVVEKERINF